jgi:hypothetical protein
MLYRPTLDIQAAPQTADSELGGRLREIVALSDDPIEPLPGDLEDLGGFLRAHKICGHGYTS